MDKSWLVTGGAGFIGANFVHAALASERPPSRIVNLDALTYAGNTESLLGLADPHSHHFVHGSIGDAERVTHLLECSLKYWRGLDERERSNFRFLHVSTDEVYGSLGDQGRFTETTPYAPNSPYSASKAASDHLVRAFHHTYGLPTLTTNCSNKYGPYQFPEKLVPLIIQKALVGEPLPVYGDGRNVRDWLYVLDHCSAIRAVLERGRIGEVYNVGGDAERENLEVVHRICDLLDARQPLENGRARRELIRFVPDRPGHDRRYAIDASKIRDELGWQPQQSFESGIERTIDWYLAHQDWCARIRDGSYRGERLGLLA